MTDTPTDKTAAETNGRHATPAPRKTPWMAKVPGLRIFVSPDAYSDADREAAAASSSIDTYESTRTRGEAVPWERPGSKLRVSHRAAARGFYAPRLHGAPSTTRQAEILQTALLAPPTGAEGIVNGRDHLSRTIISYDPITAYNSTPRLITSPNVLIIGDVGAAKSTGTKVNYVLRPLILNKRRAVVFDKKDRKGQAGQAGEGEYAELTRFTGTEPLRFDGEGDGTRLNLLDPAVLAGAGIGGQADLLLAVTRIVRGDQPANEWEENAARFALRQLLADSEGGRAVTAADLLPYLGRAPQDADLSDSAKERYHQAGITMRLALENLLDSFAGIFDGETSPYVNLDHKLTTFDISQLPPDGPAVPVVMAIGHMWLLGRARRERGWRTNVIYEEGWHMIGGPSARLVKANQKLSRSLGFSNVFVMHKGTDIPKGSEGYTVVQEAQTLYAYRQSRYEDALWVQEAFDLDPESVETLQHLPVGHAIFKYGDRPETRLEVVRSRWEAQMTNTDEGLAEEDDPAE